MNPNDDPFAPENITLTAEQIDAWRAGQIGLEKNGKEIGRTTSSQHIWCAFKYQQQLKLAQETRCAVIAVQAELYRLWFKAYERRAKPIALGNQVFKSLGFSHHDKKRALEILEAIGSIKVEWRGRQTPLVTIFKL